MRKTKIICTIGPSTNTYEKLVAIAKAGMNVARINMAHEDHEEGKRNIDNIKKVRKDLNIPLAIMVDIKGPEIRTGKVDEVINFKKGDKMIFTGEQITAHDNIVPINYPEIAKDLKSGGHILLNDGLFSFIIDSIKDGLIYCTAETDGYIGNHKNMHFPEASLHIPFIREKDINDMNFAIANNVEFIACSFVSRGDDVAQVRKYLDEHGGEKIALVAKIENMEGVNNLDEIMNYVEGVMVARGDLGVEIDISKLPSIQKKMITKIHMAGKVAITATEMLESMTHNPRPTRAEVCDVANAVYDGTSCVMLSGETSVGEYPVEVVSTMAKICVETESCIDYAKNFKKIDFTISNVPDALSHSSVNAGIDLKAKAIVVCTKTGRTARMVSRFRPTMPIISLVTEDRAYNQLAMSWGVYPEMMQEYYSTEELTFRAVDKVKDKDYINIDDIVIILAGIARQENASNLMRIEKIR